MKILASLLLSTILLYGSASAQAPSESGYGDNLVTLLPFSGYASTHAGDVLVGISYERFLSEHISLRAPVKVGLLNSSIQALVGAKFYTVGHDTEVSYSLGPAFIFNRSVQEEEAQLYSDDIWIERIEEETVTQFGFILLNSLNVTIQHDIFIGMETGLGINYINHIEREGRAAETMDPGVSFLFDISMGYRF